MTDDCSSNSTFSVLQSLASNDERIKIFRNELNSGSAISRNNSRNH
ncbi:glycosyltransferase [Vibrio sp.]